MAILKTAYPNTKVEPRETFNLWYAVYGKADFEIAKMATNHIIRTEKFFPTILEFGKQLQAATLACQPPLQKTIASNSLPKATEEQVQAVIKEFFPNA